MTVYDKFGTFGRNFDSKFTLVTSPFFSSTVLAILRLAIAVYTTVTIVLDIILSADIDHDAARWPAFFTHLTHLGLCAYFWATTIQTSSFNRNGEESYALQRAPRVLQLMQVLLQASIITLPLVVSIAFWTLLAKGAFDTTFDAWINVSFHILNSVYALFEVFATNIAPMPWMALPVMLVIVLMYTAYAYIVHAVQGFYPYVFLDPSVEHAKVFLYIIGVLAAECIIFAVLRQVIVWRSRAQHKSHYTQTSSA